MRNSQLPKEVQEMVNQQTNRMTQSLLMKNSHSMTERAILALEFLLGEESLDKNGAAFLLADSVVADYYQSYPEMDDGEKFTQDGESRGSNYQHGGIG